MNQQIQFITTARSLTSQAHLMLLINGRRETRVRGTLTIAIAVIGVARFARRTVTVVHLEHLH